MTKKQKERAANNSIGYGVNGHSLRLNVPKTIHPTGKNQRIGAGLRDTKENRVQVENLCLRLNTLLSAGQNIDWDNLAQYMPWKQHLILVAPSEVKNIGWLIDSYYEMALKPTLKESSQFRYEDSILPKLRDYRENAIDNNAVDLIMRDFLGSPSASKQYALSLLERAFDWAIQREKLVPRPNPFKDLRKQVSSTPRVNPLTGMVAEYVGFTREERDLILSRYLVEHPAYHPIIYFLFHTGCRHGEAFPLTWDDVSDDFREVRFTKVYSSNANKVLQGTKTDKQRGKIGRKFYCPGYLQEWLKERKSMSIGNLIFPLGKERYISSGRLGKTWNKYVVTNESKRYTYDGVVLKLAKEGLVAEYISAYHTRHTFISLAIESGLDTLTIADICGNSDSMVNNVYRSKIRNIDWNLLN
jgi:integrase